MLEDSLISNQVPYLKITRKVREHLFMRFGVYFFGQDLFRPGDRECSDLDPQLLSGPIGFHFDFTACSCNDALTFGARFVLGFGYNFGPAFFSLGDNFLGL